MNLEDLVGLTEWVDVEIVRAGVMSQYQALQAILNANAQPNNAKAPFEEQKNALTTTLISVDLSRLNIDQLSFLDKLNIGPVVGQRGVDLVENILVKNPVDIATAVAQLGQTIGLLSDGVSKSAQIKNGLEGLVDLPQSGTGEIIVRVNFSGDAAMANVVDFKKWGSDWHDIGRGIAMIHDVAPEEIRIVGAKKGSIIIELGVAYAIARTVSEIILETLKVAERVMAIRLQAETIRGLRLNNDQIEQEIIKAADSEKAKGIQLITTAVVERLGKNPNEEGDKVNALESAIKKLIAFIEKGGELDCVVPDEDSSAADDDAEAQTRNRQLAELRASFSNIRELESKIKHLEFKATDE